MNGTGIRAGFGKSWLSLLLDPPKRSLPVLTSPSCRRLLLVPLTTLLLASWWSSSASADGATTVAGAPLVVYGQQQFGNTATGGIDRSSGICVYDIRSHWLLPVTAGDQITIDWEIQATDTLLRVYPLGTNDFNIGQTQLLQYQELTNNGRSELVFTAPASGSLPLVFQGSTGPCSDDGYTGPYDFTADVRHVVRLSLPRLAAVRRKAVLPVVVRSADGQPISDPSLLVDVQLRTRTAWLTVGRAPANGGQAQVALNIPRRYRNQLMRLRAVAQGANYLTASTRAQPVLVFQRAKPRARRRGHSSARVSSQYALAAEDPPYDPAAGAEECMWSVSSPSMQGKVPQRLRGAHALHLQVWAAEVRVATPGGPSCDRYGSRTIQLWAYIQDDHHRRHRNSPILTPVRHSNAQLLPTWLTFSLFQPYRCMPRSKGGKKPKPRLWGIMTRTIATYGGQTRRMQFDMRDTPWLDAWKEEC
jgi:hypothetical protein